MTRKATADPTRGIDNKIVLRSKVICGSGGVIAVPDLISWPMFENRNGNAYVHQTYYKRGAACYRRGHVISTVGQRTSPVLS